MRLQAKEAQGWPQTTGVLGEAWEGFCPPGPEGTSPVTPGPQTSRLQACLSCDAL